MECRASELHFDILTMDRIVSNLVEVSEQSSFDAAGVVRDWREASLMYGELIFNAIGKSDFKHMNGMMWAFNGEIYVPISWAMFSRAIELYCRRMRISATNMYYSLNKWVRKARESVFLNCVLRPSFCVQAFENGVVDFRDGRLMEFSNVHHVIYKHRYVFDPSAKCPLWTSFLREVLEEPESRLILQMFLGLCTYDRGFMTDKVENCLVMYGEGSNGKSTIQEVVKGVLGHENVSSMGLKPLTKGGDEQQRNIGAIDGKLLNMGSELSPRDIVGHEDAFKSLCSGEQQYGRQIGKNVYKVDNVPWMIFNTNNMLKLEDTSHGVMRRIIWLVFDKIIPTEAQNTRLATDLEAEYSGIMNWIISGGKKLKKARYKFPISKKGSFFAKREEGENDLVRSWCNTREVRFTKRPGDTEDVGRWFTGAQLYEDVVKYAEINGFNCKVTRGSFPRDLMRVSGGILHRHRRSDGMCYMLFGLTEEQLASDLPLVEGKDNYYHDDEYMEQMYFDL